MRALALRRMCGRLPIRLCPQAPVLLYHATFAEPPAELKNGLHNVSPDALYAHLSWVRRHYTIVSIDEYARSRRRRGLAAITFDDAYVSVFKEAWPVLRSLDVPCTVFINSCTLNGQAVWRDKVRFIINRRLVEEWEQFSKLGTHYPGESFYRYTKRADVNSRIVDALLDEFLADRGLADAIPKACVSAAETLIRHPLVAYGNHTHSHYVLSSLSDEEQRTEIETTHRMLAAIADVDVSTVLSLPFGGGEHCNAQTLRVAREFGYEAVLFSGLRPMFGSGLHGLEAISRWMPHAGRLDKQLSYIPRSGLSYVRRRLRSRTSKRRTMPS